MTATKDPLVTAVEGLTTETTELLVEYRNIKTDLESTSSTASKAAQDAKVSADTATDKAAEATLAASKAAADVSDQLKKDIKTDLDKSTSNVVVSKQQVTLAKAEVTKAAQQVTLATKQAVLAKASADKASQVSGLDTVAEAVQVALADSYQYAMIKAEFDANRETNKNTYAGSGFVEWGKHNDGGSETAINEGLTTSLGGAINGKLLMGSGGHWTPKGISKTLCPIVNIGGVIHEIYGSTTNFQLQNNIQLPPAPDGTKTYDSKTGITTDHLTALSTNYPDADGNPTVAADKNEAVARAFEGGIKNGDFRFGDDGSWFEADSSDTPFEYSNNTLKLSASLPNGWSSARQNVIFKSGTLLKFKIAAVSADNLILVAESDGFDQFRRPNIAQGDEFSIPVVTNGTWVKIANINSGHSITISDVSITSPTENVITSRKDLVFLETWHEDTSEKGVLVPFGNVQYGATSWEDIPLKKLTDLGVGQGYSAFGQWDAKTVGYGALISELTDAQLKKFLQDPKNNIYFDAETGKLIQVRYRIRVIEGKSDDWQVNISNGGNGYAFQTGEQGSKFVRLRGSLIDIPDLTPFGSGDIYMSPAWDGWSGKQVGHAYPQINGTHGSCRAIPICTVQRMNQGGYHPAYNPSGTNKWCELNPNGTSWGEYPWYAGQTHAIDKATTKRCFMVPEPTQQLGDLPWCGHGGRIGKSSGRQSNDPYHYYDVIYAGQVEDLRLSAHKQNDGKLLTDSIRKAVAGEMRGKGKVPVFEPIFRWKVREIPAGNTSGYCYIKNYESLKGFGWISSNNVGQDVVLAQVTATAPFKTKLTCWSGIIFNKTKNLHAMFYGGSSYMFITSGSEADNSLAWNAYHYYPNGEGVDAGNWVRDNSAVDDVIEIWAHTTLNTPEYDELPWTDIIGSPENIAATFPNGVVGQWIPHQGVTYYPLNRKQMVNKPVNSISTRNSGLTWTSIGHTYDATENTLGASQLNPSDVVALVQYTAKSNFTEIANNAKATASSTVTITTRPEINQGNRLQGSLLDSIGKDTSNSLTDVSKTRQTSATIGHVPHDFVAPANNSTGCKVAHSIIEKDGLLYSQYQAIGIVNNSTDWGDTSNAIPVVNDDSTHTDDNGTTVKVVNHISKIPLGIASYSDSSQSTK